MMFKMKDVQQLKSKQDFQDILVEIVKPLEKYFNSHSKGIKFDTSGAVFGEDIREIEALLRPLWGIIPLLIGGGKYDGYEQYLNQIKNGVNPNHPHYWGDVKGCDQRMVEMAVIGLGMCLAKETFWNLLADEDKKNLYHWTNQINHVELPNTNWLFFRVLVNIGFKNCDQRYNQERINQDLQKLDSFYLDRGWYVDGYPNQIDYYIPFAFHFYAIIYIKVIGDEDSKYVPVFKQRAIEFAQTFKGFFDRNGVAVPYGRSLSYRFAQSAFWGALALADIEAIPWGEIKFLALQNLRHWLDKDIFSASGELTVGYYYRNLLMAEGYNSYGSPYWALKSFIFLALPDNHPFWLAEEVVPKVSESILLPEARMVLKRNDEESQIQAFTVGQNCEGHAHVEAKYEKFVYSTTFGFSVPKGTVGIRQGAFDNTLAVSEGDAYYRTRFGVEDYQIEEECLISTWKPWQDVQIKTTIIPRFPWHIRIHEVITARTLSLIEGGFGVDAEHIFSQIKESNRAFVQSKEQFSGIVNLKGFMTAENIWPEPNTHLYYTRSVIPTLQCQLSPGKHLMVSAVLGSVSANSKDLWNKVPQVLMDENKVTIEQ